MTKKVMEEIARRVLEVEAAAVLQLSENLPVCFVDAVLAIQNTKGRVIVSGVGKSGHIGRKIAATLASTGTPASFVHATEASHGDLGMITRSDFCLLISNSGETAELRDIVAHAGRFGIPMGAISAHPNSTLMQSVDYKLTLPTAPEACSIGMVPTTSTTLALAFGDALAVTLMELRGFRPKDFKLFHPGGKLGAKMTTVAQVMRGKQEMAIFSPNATMREVILRMTETGFGMAVLLDKEAKLCGVITDGDLRRNFENLACISPLDIASANPIHVDPTDLVQVAVRKMETSKVYSVLVLENKLPIGLLRMHDILRAGIA